MKSLNYYFSKIIKIFSPSCPENSCENKESFYEDTFPDPCTENRGWYNDGTRCKFFQKQGLLSGLAGMITENILSIGGGED